MTLFLCKLWPYLAGGLIGWLLAGWFARRLKHTQPPIERIVEKEVEKVVDNPEHLSLISKLESENNQISTLMSRIAELEAKGPKTVEKEVEKVVEVDNPKLLARIKELESANKELEELRKKVKQLEINKAQSSTAPADSEQEKVIEKIVDNPVNLSKIKALEEEVKRLKEGPRIDLKAARAAGIKIKDEHDLTAIEGIGPKIDSLIKAEGIQTFRSLADTQATEIQSILDKGGPAFKMANPGTWPDQANLAANNRWPALKALQDVLDGGVYPDSKSSKKKTGNNKSNHKTKAQGSKTRASKLNLEAAKAAGFKLKQKDGQDDFTLIEGIGPKINDLIHAAGIHTFAELAETSVDAIQKILDDAGPNYKLAKPGSWPDQAKMAANNEWEALKKWQDEMDGGIA